MSGLVLRRARKEDLPFVEQVYASTIGLWPPVTADTTPPGMERRQLWLEEHQGRFPVWMVEQEGQPVGWASLTPFKARAAYDRTAEVSLYLAEAHRGRGLGKQAYALVEEQARRLDFQRLVALIFAVNTPSMQLFAQLGYERWGLLPAVCLLQDKELDVAVVGKKL